MPILHDKPFTIRVEHDGLGTEKYVVNFAADPGGEVKASLEIPVSELSDGKVEKSVTLPSGNYVGTVTAVGATGSTTSDPVPVPVFFPAPSKPVLVIVTT